jgi:DNA-binding transcriptional MerR regulator
MPTTRTYSPAELCALLNLPKSTLLRWEREGVLSHIKRDISDTRDQRQYTVSDIRLVAQKQMEQLERRYTLASKVEDLVTYEQLEELYQEYRLRRFLAGDLMGLRELAEAHDLPPETIQLLLRAASDLYQPGDEEFGEILRVLRKFHDKASREDTTGHDPDSSRTATYAGVAPQDEK